MTNTSGIKFFFILISFFLIKGHVCEAQNLDSTLSKYADQYQPERAYLHFDKSSYFPGEIIWFKAYIMEGLYPSDDSKTFYLDWVAEDGNVLFHTVAPVIEGVTNGQCLIPENYKGNYIHIRGYTKWMLNFDTAFFYSKDIRILPKNPVTKTTQTAIIANLDFFPEGGDAVAGITNNYAFKANDQWGRPIKVKGILQSSKGTFIDSVHSIHDGMGSFTFIPVEGAIYFLKWKDERGTEHMSKLPLAKSSGIALQVATLGTKKYIQVNASNNIAESLKHLHILGTLNQRSIFKTDLTVEPGGNGLKIVPVENLPSGILTITVFDANWNAAAERITFVNNHEYSFHTSMNVQHWGLNKRARNEILLSVPDSIGPSSLSISITDAAIESDSSDNIISHLLLTSEVKGRVHNPSYYFSNNSDSTAKHLELVLLTNGWRRFKWEEVIKGKYPSFHYPKDISYLHFSGQVFGVSKSQISGSDDIILLIKNKDSSTRMFAMNVHPNATFGDPSMIFFDTLHVYYHLKAKLFGTAEAKFMTDRLPALNYIYSIKKFLQTDPDSDTLGFYHHSILALQALKLLEDQRGKILKTIVVTAKSKSPVQILDEKYTSGLFKGGDSYQFDLVNDAMINAYPNIFYYLQSKVAGLTINTTSNPPSLQWRGSSPTLFLDEMQADPSMISDIPVSDVAYIKVFRPPFIGAIGGGAGGAIAVYTRKGNDQSNSKSGLSNNMIAGYTQIKEFYSPNYDRYDSKNDQPDVRTTLYWNPSVSTDQKTHKAIIYFYNNDLTKSFRVIIDGLSKDGLFTHLEEIME